MHLIDGGVVARRGRPRWLVLIHQIPPKPGYLRVKIWRRLQRLGAVAVKNSVYVLPRGDQANEDFQWVLREIVAGGGDATLCEAHFVEGLSDGDLEALFRSARDADYRGVAEEASRLLAGLPSPRAAGGVRGAHPAADLARLRRRIEEVAAIDFLGAPGRSAAEAVLARIEARLAPPRPPAARREGTSLRRPLRGRIWVTRRGVHVDRMASAWLIRRFIDPRARFKFVPGRSYRPRRGEVRFDMFDAEFTHEDDRCTFEVLLERLAIRDPALRPIAAIIHDIDLKDGTFGRPETDGIDHAIAGIAMGNADDRSRLARGGVVFDALYEYFRRKEA